MSNDTTPFGRWVAKADYDMLGMMVELRAAKIGDRYTVLRPDSVLEEIEPGTEVGPPFLTVPVEAALAIRDALCEKYPDDSAAEIRTLREALRVERERVDRFLGGDA